MYEVSLNMVFARPLEGLSRKCGIVWNEWVRWRRFVMLSRCLRAFVSAS